MLFHKISLAAFATAALAMAGCSSDRFASSSASPVQPVVIQAAPLGQISQSILPPPGGNYPAAVGQAQTASLGPAPAGVELSAASVAGVWKASIGGMNCQVATPQTKFGKGYRAGPLHCPAAFAGVNSWSVNGSQLVFYDNAGNSVVALYSSDGARFEGYTPSGIQVVLSR